MQLVDWAKLCCTSNRENGDGCVERTLHRRTVPDSRCNVELPGCLTNLVNTLYELLFFYPKPKPESKVMSIKQIWSYYTLSQSNGIMLDEVKHFPDVALELSIVFRFVFGSQKFPLPN